MNQQVGEASMRPVPIEKPASLRLILWILLIVYIFNFLDRQIVNILAEPIKQDLNLSDTQLGLMTGLAFALFYTVLGIPIARYADRPTTNRVGLISVALLVWSGMTAICGVAQNFVQLLLARIGVGVGEAGCTPAAHSLIADMTTPETRPAAISFYSLGIPIGGLLGLVLGGQLADAFGWRLAFVVVGLPGVMLAGLVWLLLRDPRMGATATALRNTSVKLEPVSAPHDRGVILCLFELWQGDMDGYFLSAQPRANTRRNRALAWADGRYCRGGWHMARRLAGHTLR